MNEHEQKKIASEIVLRARAECRKKKINPYIAIGAFIDEVIKELTTQNTDQKIAKFFNLNNFNLSIYKQRLDDKFLIRTFEAGVGETLSCGSGSSATAFAIFDRNPSLDKVFLNSSGGQMICYKKDHNKICSKANTEIINKSEFDEREYF